MNIYDMKVTHTQATQLVQLFCSWIIAKHDIEDTLITFGSAMRTAVTFETLEVIEEIIRLSPRITDPYVDAKSIFLEAITRRQDRIYNLFYQITSFRMMMARGIDEITHENVLHTVAKSVPPYKFTSHTGGAALQMQFELQWFKAMCTGMLGLADWKPPAWRAQRVAGTSAAGSAPWNIGGFHTPLR
ncbi:hypothetical protein OSB04_010204 [Centaurea solstitialis]|uniref:Uncharacterized protein n=1 Tax=Centaurea solstitialis TaxID=347529 RepID=A0AA38WKE7_9ASTR|nr:hypothetical protein OSB04_010204 [Centaurea solstitialis]